MSLPFVLRVRHATLVVLALVFAVGLGRAHATVMVEVPLATLANDADAIVVGIVERVGVRLRLTDGSSVPHTITTLRVREWLKGEGAEVVRIDEIGGVLPNGQEGLMIAGTPEYTRGEEVVVFLRRCGDCGQGVMRTYAMEQGRFAIQRGVPGVEDVVQRDLSAIGFARWAPDGMEVDHGGRSAMRLSDFLGYLRATLEQLEGSVGTVGGGSR